MITATSNKGRGDFISWLVVLAALAALFAWVSIRLTYQWNWSGFWNYKDRFVAGWFTTVWISALSLLLSLVCGAMVAAARRCPFQPLRLAGQLYVEIIRGMPLLVMTLVFFYIIAPAFGLENRYVCGVMILALFSGAYIAEILRAGVESVGASQRESARAIGLTKGQTYRYVILPQMVRQVLPPLAGEFSSLVKNSSLLSIIAVNELTQNARDINALTYSSFESYLPLAAGYLAITIPLSLWSRSLERRFHYET